VCSGFIAIANAVEAIAWAEVSEIEEDGCILVRPDLIVGWRARQRPADPSAALRHALARILGRAST
jgi:2,4-dichlorophenol 6-monooxygenase